MGLALVELLAGQGLNLQPPGPKPGVLPVELPATKLNHIRLKSYWVLLGVGPRLCPGSESPDIRCRQICGS